MSVKVMDFDNGSREPSNPKCGIEKEKRFVRKR
jgi:hypothetical protein